MQTSQMLRSYTNMMRIKLYNFRKIKSQKQQKYTQLK